MISKDEARDAIKYLRHVARYHERKSTMVTAPHAVKYQENAAKHLNNAADILELYIK